MVAVEAMAAGTAAVASAHGAFPELVTHGNRRGALPAIRCRTPSSTSWPRSTTTRNGGTISAARAASTTYRQPVQPQTRAWPGCWRSIASLYRAPGTKRSRAPATPFGPYARAARRGLESSHDIGLRRGQPHRRPDHLERGVTPGGATPRLGCGRSRHLEPEQPGAWTVRRGARSVPAASARSRSPYSPTRWSSTPRGAWRRIRSSSAISGRIRVRRWRMRDVGGSTGTAPCGRRRGAVSCASVAGLLLPDPVRSGIHRTWASGCLGLLCRTAGDSPSSPSGRGSSAFLNDLFWTVLLCRGSRRAARLGGDSAARTALLAFGGTATLAAVLGSGSGPDVAIARSARWTWLRDAPRSYRFGTSSRTSASAVHRNCVPSCWARSPALRPSATCGRLRS